MTAGEFPQIPMHATLCTLSSIFLQSNRFQSLRNKGGPQEMQYLNVFLPYTILSIQPLSAMYFKSYYLNEQLSIFVSRQTIDRGEDHYQHQ